jgi:hypothetical protein
VTPRKGIVVTSTPFSFDHFPVDTHGVSLRRVFNPARAYDRAGLNARQKFRVLNASDFRARWGE